MPVFRAGSGQAPPWCEMRQFDIVRLPAGAARYDFGRAGPREKLIVGEGACTVEVAGREQAAGRGANIDLPAGEEAAGFSILEVAEDATLIRMAGHWGEEGRRLRAVLVGGGGRRRPRRPRGSRPLREADKLRLPLPRLRRVLDPLRRPRRRVSEGKSYEVASGDCVATGMGHHHDFPIVHEPVQAVYFETTMEGQRRRGHLWDHTHGKAEARAERV